MFDGVNSSEQLLQVDPRFQGLAYGIGLLYVFAMLFVATYSIAQLRLLYFYRRTHNRGEKPAATPITIDTPNLPFVTVQLPVYNERYVFGRLIDAVTKFQYPKDRFEIHILDDSTDETVRISEEKVKEYEAQGFQIKHIHRTNRQGFKAGALKEGMSEAKGELIAIFDADFLPDADFLLKTVPHFMKDPKVAVVQTRWEHLNRNYNLLTRLQAIQLDVHFTIEQLGRYGGGLFLQFNGTGGVWRREAIDDAGGWEADTLTEDLDLSYRAQFKGWKIVYLEDVTAPAELPAEMHGLKSQQFRWTKGGAETARKMLPTILRSNLSFKQKFHCIAHLMGSTVFIFAFLLILLSTPVFLLQNYFKGMNALYVIPILYFNLVALTIVYFSSIVRHTNQHLTYGQRIVYFLTHYPLFFSMSIGMALHNTVAVLQGWAGKKSAFVRTPKFNIVNSEDKLKKSTYNKAKISWVTIAEGLLSLFFIVTCYWAYMGDFGMFMFFPLMNAVGFGGIFFFTIKNLFLKH